jgi:hypothetical protein
MNFEDVFMAVNVTEPYLYLGKMNCILYQKEDVL